MVSMVSSQWCRSQSWCCSVRHGVEFSRGADLCLWLAHESSGHRCFSGSSCLWIPAMECICKTVVQNKKTSSAWRVSQLPRAMVTVCRLSFVTVLFRSLDMCAANGRLYRNCVCYVDGQCMPVLLFEAAWRVDSFRQWSAVRITPKRVLQLLVSTQYSSV